MHGHGGPGPAVRDVSHPGQVHVHDAGIESGLTVVRDLVTRGVIVVQTGGHGRHVLRGEIIKEGPEIFRRSEKFHISISVKDMEFDLLRGHPPPSVKIWKIPYLFFF